MLDPGDDTKAWNLKLCRPCHRVTRVKSKDASTSQQEYDDWLDFQKSGWVASKWMVGWCFNYQIMVGASPRATIIVRVRHPFTPSPVFGRGGVEPFPMTSFEPIPLWAVWSVICLSGLSSFLVIIPKSLFVWSEAWIKQWYQNESLGTLCLKWTDIILNGLIRLMEVIGREKLSLVWWRARWKEKPCT